LTVFAKYIIVQLMRVQSIILGLWAGMAACMAADAEAPKVRIMSLDDCVKSALEHNLDVQIERLNPDIARYAVSMGYAAYDPTFSVQGVHDFNKSPGSYDSNHLPLPGGQTDANTYQTSLGGLLPTGTSYSLNGNIYERYGLIGSSSANNAFGNSGGGANISLTQPLLKNFWIDSARYTIRISKKALEKSDINVGYVIMSTITSVENGYYDLISAREMVKVQEKALELSTKLYEENKKRVELGALAPLSEKQAESQMATTKSALLKARQQVQIQQNVLKQLIHDNYSQWSAIEVEPAAKLTAIPQAFSLQDSWHKGMTMRPDLQQARLDVESKDIELRFTRNQLFPELDLIGSYGHSGANSAMRDFGGVLDQMEEGSSPNYSYGAVLSIPLTNKKARYSYKTSKAQKQQILLQLKQLEQNILVNIDNAVKDAQTSLDSVTSTKDARVYAEAALDAQQKLYENGKSTSYEVLQIQRDLTAAESNEISALASYNKALATLALAEGATLERHQINVAIKK
jgi:outer membrane protein TolC